jgi:hypothetical protein
MPFNFPNAGEIVVVPRPTRGHRRLSVAFGQPIKPKACPTFEWDTDGDDVPAP